MVVTKDAEFTGELEVVVAEMENRLRNLVLRLIRPALDKVSDSTSSVEKLSEKVGEFTHLVEVSETMNSDLKEFHRMIDELSAQLEEIRKEKKQADISLNIQQAELNIRLVSFDSFLQNLQIEFSKQSRETSRLWNEAERIEAQHKLSSKENVEAIEKTSRRAGNNHDSLLVMVRDLQKQREELSEDLFGHGKVIPSLRAEVSELQGHVSRIPDLEVQLERVLEAFDCLREQSSRSETLTMETQATLLRYQEITDRKLNDMKDEFQKKGNEMISHHMSVMKNIRSEYIDELKSIRELKIEIQTMSRSANAMTESIIRNVESESKRVAALHKAEAEEVAAVDRRRQQDRISLASEIHELRREGNMRQDVNGRQNAAIEYLGRIVGLVLESERVSNALEVQDFADRFGEKWLGPPTHQPRTAESSATAEELLYGKRLSSKLLGGGSDLVHLDVKKGFRLDSYMPGRVVFRDKPYDRRDLLVMRHKLLETALQAYERGPASDDKHLSLRSREAHLARGAKESSRGCAAVEVTPQRSAVGTKFASKTPADSEFLASGGCGHGYGPSPKTESFVASGGEELQRQRASAGQRPGSQGQPQAMGSRGSDFGPIGETEPAKAVRLPQISDGKDRGRGCFTAR